MKPIAAALAALAAVFVSKKAAANSPAPAPAARPPGGTSDKVSRPLWGGSPQLSFPAMPDMEPGAPNVGSEEAFESNYPAPYTPFEEGYEEAPAPVVAPGYTPFEDNYPTDPDTNVAAFLAAVRDAEGTSREPDPYRVVFGYGLTLQDLSDHPTNTGEWVGSSYGADWTTAAGAYQFIAPTWASLQMSGDVWDFSPDSQDAGAVALLRRRRVLELVRAGKIREALERGASYEWASLWPGRYGQPQRSLEWFETQYQSHGGTLA
jgi:muramidase (phage lysozyme)